MTSNLSDEAPNSPDYVVTTRWALEGILMVLVGVIGIIGIQLWAIWGNVLGWHNCIHSQNGAKSNLSVKPKQAINQIRPNKLN